MTIWTPSVAVDPEAALQPSTLALHELGRRLAWTPEAAWEWIARLQEGSITTRPTPRALGVVATPAPIAARMSRALLAGVPRGATVSVLDAGCGDARLLAAVVREASRCGLRVAGSGIEIEPATARWAQALAPLAHAGAPDTLAGWRIHRQDFLLGGIEDTFDAVIANPPYVPWRALDAVTRGRLRSRFASAPGDLAGLFVERMLDVLRPDGRLCVIVPNKLLATRYAATLRARLARETTIEQIWDLSTLRVFPGHASYPVVIVARRRPARPGDTIRIVDAAGDVRARWLQAALGALPDTIVPLALQPELGELALRLLAGPRLGEAIRVRCGIASSGFGRAVGIGTDRILRSGDVRPFHLRSAARFAPRRAGLAESALLRMRCPKVVVPGMFRRLAAAYDGAGRLLGRVYYLPVEGRTPAEREARRALLLALLNSRLYALLYTGLFGAVAQSGGYTRLNAPYLECLPWPERAPDPDLVARAAECENQPHDAVARGRLDRAVEDLFRLSKEERRLLDRLACDLPTGW